MAQTTRLHISILGPLVVTRNGERTPPFVSRKAQGLLVYLALEPDRPHTREELMTLLWPDYATHSARASLRNVLANVRKVIGDRDTEPPLLLIAQDSIQRNPAAEWAVDVDCFDQPLRAEALTDPAIQAVEMALGRFNGTILTGCDLGDSPQFDEWLLLKREHYVRQISACLSLIVAHEERERRHASALNYARRRVEIEFLDEDAHRQLLRLHAKLGQRNQAIAHFDHFRALLDQELGIPPDDVTVALIERIRRGELDEAGEDGIVSRAPHRVQRLLKPLIGRIDDLAQMRRLLAVPHNRLLTIVGPGGIGKTHLAVAVAMEEETRFEDGAAFVALAGLEKADGLAATVASALNLAFDKQTSVEAQVSDYLRDKHLLLLLDNFEHLLDGVPIVEEWLRFSPRLTILITSRIPVRADGEQRYPLRSLSYPPSVDGQELPADMAWDDFEAVALFLECTRRLRPQLNLTNRAVDMMHVVHICQLLDGMPLGIMLASSWIESLSPEEIAHELQHDLSILQADAHGLPGRHQRMTAVLEHSWNLLSVAEQTVFARLSVFRGGWTREAAESIAGATLHQLNALVTKCFLTRAVTGRGSAAGRFSVHELMRQFAKTKLAQRGDFAETQGRHAGFYLRYLADRTQALRSSNQLTAMTEIDAEFENIRAAWKWASSEKGTQLLLSSVYGLGHYFAWGGRYQEGRAIIIEAIARIDLPATDADTIRLLVGLLYWRTRFSHNLGEREDAEHSVADGFSQLDRATEIGIDVRMERGIMLCQQGIQEINNQRAAAALQEGTLLLRSVDAKWELAQGLVALARCWLNRPGTDAQGQTTMEEGLQILLTLEDRYSICVVLSRSAFSSALRGNHQEGEERARKALTIAKSLKSSLRIAECTQFLSLILYFKGDFVEASELALDNIDQHRSLKNQFEIAGSLLNATVAMRHLGKYNRTLSMTEEALAILTDTHDSKHSYGLWLQGDDLLALGDLARAQHTILRSVALHRKHANRGRLNDVLTSLGFVGFHLGEQELVHRSLLEISLNSTSIRQWYTAIRTTLLTSLAAVIDANPAYAVELYALASASPHVSRSVWYEHIIGRHVREAAANLSSDAIAAAESRGRARDLWQTVDEIAAAYADFQS